MSDSYKVLYISCVILLNQQGEVLIGRRRPEQVRPGMWEIPGGKLEAGEYPIQAACREMAEEVGITLNPDDLTPLTFVTNNYPEVTSHAVVMIYLTETWQGIPTAQEGQEIKWVKLAEMAQL